MKVCVTGANGFVGSNLCKILIEKGYQVNGLVRNSGNLEFIDNLSELEFFIGDITDPNSLNQAFSGASIVYHVAGYTSDWGKWQKFQAVNIQGVNNVMECAVSCAVKRVVHVSSVSVYGFPDAIDINEDQSWILRPDDPYVTSKQKGEEIALGFNGNGIEVTVLRPAGLYGPNDRTTSLKLLPEIAGRRLPYIDGGKYLMGPVYIDNFVQAAILAGEKASAPGQAYNIVDDGKTTWRQYIELICAGLKCGKPLLSVPAWIAWPLASLVESLAKALSLKDAPPITKYRIRAVMGDSHFNSDKAKRELGYKPEISTQEGIRRTVNWYIHYTTQTTGQE